MAKAQLLKHHPRKPVLIATIDLPDDQIDWPETILCAAGLFVFGSRYVHAAVLGVDCFYLDSCPTWIELPTTPTAR